MNERGYIFYHDWVNFHIPMYKLEYYQLNSNNYLHLLSFRCLGTVQGIQFYIIIRQH